MKRKLFTRAATLAAALIMASSLAACGADTGNNGGDNQPTQADDSNQQTSNEDVKKPEKISMMMTTIITKENGLQKVEEEYEKNTGIKLEVEKPDHNQYYEKVNLSFTSGNVPDVVEMGSIYYPQFADNGALWDMTDAYANSTAPVKSIIDEKYVDALRLNGKLYGFPMAKGNGTVTYVRSDWMDELGIKDPTNYDEFIEMLRKFKTKGPNIIPITAAGLIGPESPYDIYLREFYQDAIPDFYKDESTGKYVDGMSQPQMKGALQRMKDAYAEGLIDPEIVTNKTSTSRDKLYADVAGCFNYWAGYWNVTLEENLKSGYPDATIKPIAPIAETKYIERPPTAMAITSYSQNPMGVYKYLIEYSHDGGEGQMLFTHGVEGIHWEKKEDGTATALPYLETRDKLVEKAFYPSELSITKFDDPIALDERITSSLNLFESNSYVYPVPKTSDVISNELPELDTIKKEVVANVVMGKMSIDEGIADYEKRAATQIEAILKDLNSME